MAKILKNEIDIFNENVLKRLNYSTVDYSKFFEGSPIFVTYYTRNVLSSTEDSTLNTGLAILDSNESSPIKFNKIENFPIFNCTGLSDVMEDLGDFGLETNIDGEGIIIPTLIKPIEEDYFIIPNMDENYIFKINSISPDKISGKQFWKIQFSLVPNKLEDIEKKVVEEYNVDYDKLNSVENKPILSKKEQSTIYLLDMMINNLLDYVTENYFYENMNYISININNTEIYDPFLTKFINNNKLLIRTSIKDYMDYIYLSDIKLDVASSVFFSNNEYKKTIFYCLENNSLDTFDKIGFSFLPQDKDFLNELNFEGKDIILTNYLSPSYKYLDDEFKQKYNNKIYYNQEEMKFEDTLLKVFLTGIDSFNIESIRLFVEDLKNIDFDYNIKSYYFSIILLFILNYFKKSILKVV